MKKKIQATQGDGSFVPSPTAQKNDHDSVWHRRMDESCHLFPHFHVNRPPVSLVLAAVITLGVVAFAWFADRTQRVPVLVYHDLWNNASDDQKGYTSAEGFALQMEYLHNNGYHVVSLDKLIDHIQSGRGLPGKAVVITFDDGYKSNYTLAYPVLKRYNMPATIFLIAGYDQQFPPDEVHPRLSWDEMREMEESGLIDIQAHTYNLHRRVYTDRDNSRRNPAVTARAYIFTEERLETEGEYEDRLYGDFIKARSTIETKLNKNNADTMAWPFGAYNDISVRLARKAGFKYFVTTDVGLNKHGDSVESIRRISVEDDSATGEFAKLLEPDHFYIRYFRQIATSRIKRVAVSYSL